MNLSSPSISSASPHYPGKSRLAISDAAAAAAPNAEFAELVADATGRREAGTDLNRPAASEKHEKACPTKSLSMPRERIEEKKSAKQQPNENLISQPGTISTPAADEIELASPAIPDSLAKRPVAGKDEDPADDVAATPQEFVATASEEGEGTDFEAAPSSTEKRANSAAEIEVPAESEACSPTQNVSEPGVAGEAVQNRKTPKTSFLPGAKRDGVKSSSIEEDKVAADFAESTRETSQKGDSAGKSNSKNFLDIEESGVTSRRETLGINVAKGEPDMNHPHAPRQLSDLLPKQVAAPDGMTSAHFDAQTPSLVQSGATGGLHQAVHAALEAGEKLKSGGQRSVDLEFSIGGDDLSVRVELHEGRVRATFRTDSAELRGALAQEWQVLQAAGVDRAKRFVDPVFVANSSSSAAGDRQEKRGGRDRATIVSEERFEISRAARPGSGSPARASAPLLSPETAASLTALRLQTFA